MDEKQCRKEFVAWARSGSKPFIYALDETASGEYVSGCTEYAWRAFKAGYAAAESVNRQRG